jgi:hypothetical protein
VIGASELSDGDDGLKWKLMESVAKRNKILTASPLSSFSKFAMHVRQHLQE